MKTCSKHCCFLSIKIWGYGVESLWCYFFSPLYIIKKRDAVHRCTVIFVFVSEIQKIMLEPLQVHLEPLSCQSSIGRMDHACLLCEFKRQCTLQINSFLSCDGCYYCLDNFKYKQISILRGNRSSGGGHLETGENAFRVVHMYPSSQKSAMPTGIYILQLTLSQSTAQPPNSSFLREALLDTHQLQRENPDQSP